MLSPQNMYCLQRRKRRRIIPEPVLHSPHPYINYDEIGVGHNPVRDKELPLRFIDSNFSRACQPFLRQHRGGVFP